jgi:hypothetical protein
MKKLIVCTALVLSACGSESKPEILPDLSAKKTEAVVFKTEVTTLADVSTVAVETPAVQNPPYLRKTVTPVKNTVNLVENEVEYIYPIKDGALAASPTKIADNECASDEKYTAKFSISSMVKYGLYRDIPGESFVLTGTCSKKRIPLPVEGFGRK